MIADDVAVIINDRLAIAAISITIPITVRVRSGSRGEPKASDGGNTKAQTKTAAMVIAPS